MEQHHYSVPVAWVDRLHRSRHSSCGVSLEHRAFKGRWPPAGDCFVFLTHQPAAPIRNAPACKSGQLISGRHDGSTAHVPRFQCRARLCRPLVSRWQDQPRRDVRRSGPLCRRRMSKALKRKPGGKREPSCRKRVACSLQARHDSCCPASGVVRRQCDVSHHRAARAGTLGASYIAAAPAATLGVLQGGARCPRRTGCFSVPPDLSG